MTAPDLTHALRSSLQLGRDALLWKLEGLPEYDVRRPLTRTGTNLLGLVKHVATMEAGYLGEVFGRPFHEQLPWMAPGAEPNADMWATVAESRDQIVDLYRRVWAHSDATINELALDTAGTVGWWSADRNPVTLEQILVYMIAETARHAGHADIVRELIDGNAGWRAGSTTLPPGDQSWWTHYHDQLESVAKKVGES